MYPNLELQLVGTKNNAKSLRIDEFRVKVSLQFLGALDVRKVYVQGLADNAHLNVTEVTKSTTERLFGGNRNNTGVNVGLGYLAEYAFLFYNVIIIEFHFFALCLNDLRNHKKDGKDQNDFPQSDYGVRRLLCNKIRFHSYISLNNIIYPIWFGLLLLYQMTRSMSRVLRKKV